MPPNRLPAKEYRALPIAEKERYTRELIREPAISCPTCEAQTTPADLLTHVSSRCPGPREPHHASKWVTWREARDLGVPRTTFYRWVHSGRIRSDGGRYLLRDVVRWIAPRKWTTVPRNGNGGRR